MVHICKSEEMGDGTRKVAQVTKRRKMWTQRVTVWQRSWRALTPSEHPVLEETEREGHLPFLDIDTYRRADDCLCHKAYCKPNHTNPCLNSGSVTAHPTSKLYSPPRCMTVMPYIMNWSFSKALSAEQLQWPADLCGSLRILTHRLATISEANLQMH